MDPEDSPELPPLKRGTYDIEAILAAAENAEFAIPPPSSRSLSLNSNPFGSSTPSAFRSNFTLSNAPSVPPPAAYADNHLDQDEPQPPPTRVQPTPRKPISSSLTRKRVSTPKSTLGKPVTPKRTDVDPIQESNPGRDQDSSLDSFNRSMSMSVEGISNRNGTPMAINGENKEGTHSPGAGSPSTLSPKLSASMRTRPLRSSPFSTKAASPALSHSHLEPDTANPVRVGSPSNLSTSAILPGLDVVAYTTPSSSRPNSRPTSRPTSRPNSRVSSNGRFHSRQLSSDSLVSFNAMIDKDDFEEEHNRSSGHVPFLVSDPEHLKILEGEIEDPFSPSMNAIDPDTDVYLSNLIQQSSPFGSRKQSRGNSPAFRTSRRQPKGGDGGEDSFVYSTDDALSDKELNPKLRSSRTGTRTPSSPLARAVTRSEGMVVPSAVNGSAHLSLDQILRDSQETGNDSFVASADHSRNELNNGESEARRFQSEADTLATFVENNNNPEEDHQTTESGYSEATQRQYGSHSRDPNYEHVEVDIVVQNVNVSDAPGSRGRTISATSPRISQKSMGTFSPDFEAQDSVFGRSPMDAIANEEIQLHESVEIHESHAQSFAEWMSSSAEISRLEISPPASLQGAAHSLAGMMAASTFPSRETSLLSPTPQEANVLTSSFTPALSPEPSSTGSSTSPIASKRNMLLEKRSHILDDLLSKAKERTKQRAEGNQPSSTLTETDKSMSASMVSNDSAESISSPHSVTFASVPDVKVLDEEQEEMTDVVALTDKADTKEAGLARRASSLMLSSRIRDSTNLDAPRYSIREMEDMKKNVRMDLRIEITNEIREEYERSAEQEATMFQMEIEELKMTLEKERHEKHQLKGVLDEFESSLADIAVSTAKEIQTIKEENRKLTEAKEETEDAFIQLKTRYDELAGLNAKHVENEIILRRAVETLKQDFETSESRYEGVKAHADSRLVVASQEMEQARIAYDNEISMLRGQLHHQELHLRSLENALETKNKENEDLIMFSEELIAKLS